MRQENNYFETYVCINESMWCVHVLYMYVLMYVVAKTFLKIIYRYCMPSGPIERFLTFIHIRSHTGEDLAKYLLQYLEQNGINIQNCRGQSYDKRYEICPESTSASMVFGSSEKYIYIYVKCAIVDL